LITEQNLVGVDAVVSATMLPECSNSQVITEISRTKIKKY